MGSRMRRYYRWFHMLLGSPPVQSYPCPSHHAVRSRHLGADQIVTIVQILIVLKVEASLQQAEAFKTFDVEGAGGKDVLDCLADARSTHRCQRGSTSYWSHAALDGNLTSAMAGQTQTKTC